jgi:hypothetical protein
MSGRRQQQQLQQQPPRQEYSADSLLAPYSKYSASEVQQRREDIDRAVEYAHATQAGHWTS